MTAWDAASAHVRVWTFGELCVEYRAADSTWHSVQQEEWGGNSNSRRVLRYLLTVGRSARRGEIMEALWPESTSTYVEEYLNKAATNLRKVFRSEEVLTSNSKRTTYQLAQQAVIWTDVDACEAVLREAERVGPTSQEGRRLLETAQQYFARGRFFEGEDGTWCHAKRERLATAHYRCLLWLAEAYEAQGSFRQAERLIEQLLQQDPLDEAALIHLLTLLNKQGMAAEAVRRYKHATALFAQQGAAPSPSVQTLVQSFQQRPLAAIGGSILTVLPGQEYPFPRVAAHCSHADTPDRIGLVNPLDERVQVPHPAAVAQPRMVSEQAGEHDNSPLTSGIQAMKESRRRLFQQLIGLAGEALIAPQTLLSAASLDQIAAACVHASQIDRDTLADLETITRNHWHLYVHATSKGDLLSSFWGHLQTLLKFLRATPTGAQQNRLYSLVGESAQMIGEILFDMQDYPQAQTYYRFSIVAAKEAGNNALRAVGLGRMSFLPIYRHEPLQACPLLEEARQLLTDVSRPTIHAWLAVVEAEVMAHLCDDTACEKALARAEAQYHQNAPEQDVLWTRLNDATIPGYKGACYLQLQQPHKALDALQKTLAVLPTYSARHQSIILTDMAAAMLQMTEVEESCKLLQQVLELTTHKKSLMVLTRMQQVRSTLEQWKDTSYIHQLDRSVRDVLPAILA